MSSITNLKNNTLQGLVVAAYGKRYQVELADKTRISCVTRGKKTDLACGDIVNIKLKVLLNLAKNVKAYFIAAMDSKAKFLLLTSHKS